MRLEIKKELLLKSIIYWCFFCSFFLAIVYHFFKIPFNLLFLKDLFIILGFLVSIKISKQVNLIYLCIYFFIIYICIISLFSPAPIMAKIASIRQIIIPFILILIGCNLARGIRLEVIKKYVISLALVSLFFGLLEVYFSLWHYLDITEYFTIKNIPTYSRVFKDKFRYPVFFIEPIFGGIKRMVSFVLDPINLGHIFTFILALLLFDDNLSYGKRKRYFLAFLFLLGLILTFSKGALLQFILILFFVSKRISIGLKLIVILVFCVIVSYAANFHMGVKIHLLGLLEAIKNINLFGHGVGMVGNQAYMFGEPILKIGDTYFGSILGQIGVIGYLLWLVPFLIIIKKIKYNFVAKIFLAQLLISIISENSFNLLSVFLVCLFLGIYYIKKSKTAMY